MRAQKTMKLDILDKNGKSVEKLDLREDVFGVTPNTSLLAQYVRVFRANKRQGTSSVKTRAEVSGSGRKPWRQKGTGRARVGSIRSPLWRHGGIVHGPKPKDWSLAFSKRMKAAAMRSALVLKHRQNGIKTLDKLSLDKPKTKDLDQLLKTLELKGKTLIVTDVKNTALVKSAQNLGNVKVVNFDNLNVYELLAANNVLFVKDALLKLQEKFAGSV